MSKKRVGDKIKLAGLKSIAGDPVYVPHDTDLTHLQFRRFAGCPICNTHIHSFIKRHDELVANGVQVIILFYSSRESLLEYSQHIPFQVIADPNKSLYKDFGVVSSIKSIMSPSAWLAGIKGMFNHGLKLPARGESALGLPADFLVDQSGHIVALKYAKHAYDQWSVDELLSLAR